MDGNHKSDAVIDQVFLTPRVLDARAFNEYSATLQELLKEASGHHASLQTVSSEVKTLRQGVTDATTELQRRLDVAVRVLPGIDQKLAKAEKLASDANRALTIDPSERLAALQNAAAKIVTDAMAQLQGQLTEVFASSTDQARRHADELIARSGELERTATSIADSFEAQLRSRLDEVARLASESTGIFDTQARLYDDRLARRGEELEVRMRSHAIAAERTIEEKLNQLESRMMRFEQMVAETAERQAQATVAALIARADEVEQKTSGLIADAAAKLESTAQAARALTQSLSASIEAHAARLGKAETEAQNASDRLGALLATARDFIEAEEGGAAIREFRQIAARFETVRADCDFAFRQYDEIRRQAEQVKSHLGQSLLEAAAGADQILKTSDQVMERSRQCERMAQNLIEQNTRLEQAASAADYIATRVETTNAAAQRVDAELEALEQKKMMLENNLRHTGGLLDMADQALAERYNKLGSAVSQATELGEILAAKTSEYATRIDAIKAEERQTAERYRNAFERVDQALDGDLKRALATAADAAKKLEALIKQAEEAGRSVPNRASMPATSASSLFPTAR